MVFASKTWIWFLALAFLLAAPVPTYGQTAAGGVAIAKLSGWAVPGLQVALWLHTLWEVAVFLQDEQNQKLLANAAHVGDPNTIKCLAGVDMLKQVKGPIDPAARAGLRVLEQNMERQFEQRRKLVKLKMPPTLGQAAVRDGDDWDICLRKLQQQFARIAALP